MNGPEFTRHVVLDLARFWGGKEFHISGETFYHIIPDILSIVIPPPFPLDTILPLYHYRANIEFSVHQYIYNFF
jgi:hypothetical protein